MGVLGGTGYLFLITGIEFRATSAILIGGCSFAQFGVASGFYATNVGDHAFAYGGVKVIMLTRAGQSRSIEVADHGGLSQTRGGRQVDTLGCLRYSYGNVFGEVAFGSFANGCVTSGLTISYYLGSYTALFGASTSFGHVNGITIVNG